MIHLYIEHLLNIKTLSIQASLSTVSNKETKARLSADGKILTLSHENETASIELPINISPNKQSNVRFTIPAIPSKELSFRVQLEEKPGVQNGALSNGNHDSGNLVPWSAGSLTENTEVCCAQCSTVLVERSRIQAWKDLPSQGWAEMMEFWHCHKPHEPHDHAEGEMNKGYAAGNKLAVETGVGLVDLVDFIFSSEDCRNVEKLNLESMSLQCANCSTNVGSVEPISQGFGLHKPCLSVAAASTSRHSAYSMNKWLACQILAGVENQGVRKFTVECIEDNRSNAFEIWVLTPDLTISSSAAPSPTPIRTTKILWHEDESGHDNESDMKKFLTESEIKLRSDELDHLRETLQEHSLWIPEGARELQGWKVGLLERFNNDDLAHWNAETLMR